MADVPTPTGPAAPGAPPVLRTLELHNHAFNLHPLSVELDAAFDKLFDQAMIAMIQWFDFGAAVREFVRTKPLPDAMDKFFSNATPIWKHLIAAGKYEAAGGFWSSMLSVVTEAEKATGAQVHKGSGYYFWGCNAFERRDDEEGLLLMHEALVEDARTYGVASPAWPSTSSAKVVSLDAELSGEHPANWWVGDQAGQINVALERFGTKLRLADLRKRFFLALGRKSGRRIGGSRRSCRLTESERRGEAEGDEALESFMGSDGVGRHESQLS